MNPIAYRLIKAYPGSWDVGHVVLGIECPGHQWSEFYQPMGNDEFIEYLRELQRTVNKSKREVS